MHRIKASFSLGRKLRLRRAFTILSYLQKKMFEPHLLHRKQLKSPNKPPRVTQTQGSSTGPLLSEQLCLAGPAGPWAPVPSPCWIWGLRPLLLPSGTITELCWGLQSSFPSFGTISGHKSTCTWGTRTGKVAGYQEQMFAGEYCQLCWHKVGPCVGSWEGVLPPPFFYCTPDFILLYFSTKGGRMFF